MKTAMQELIEFLNELNSDQTKPPVLERKFLQKWCEISLLQKEKQQIIDAQENGHSYYEQEGINGEQYYKETYKNE